MEKEKLTLELSDTETRDLLVSIRTELNRLKAINHNSKDEDKAADAGNDYMALSSFYDDLKDKSISLFGESIISDSKFI